MKVRFIHFLTTPLKVSEGQINKIFSRTDFLSKNLLLVDPCPQNSTTEVTLKYNSLVENSITLKKNLMATKEGPIHLFVRAIARKILRKPLFNSLCKPLYPGALGHTKFFESKIAQKLRGTHWSESCLITSFK